MYLFVENATIAKVLHDQHPHECSSLRAKDVKRIYSYISHHPENDIHKQWANREEYDPEVAKLVEDFDSKLVALYNRRHFYHHCQTAVGTGPERVFSLYFARLRAKWFYG